MTNEQFQSEVMSTDLERITYSMFDKKMRDEDNCKELAASLGIHLHEKFKKEYDLEAIERCLPYVDKGLFINFRDGKVSIAQLKARVAERRGYAKYKVFDDIYPNLSEEEKR